MPIKYDKLIALLKKSGYTSYKIRQEKTYEIPCVYGENIIFCKNAQ